MPQAKLFAAILSADMSFSEFAAAFAAIYIRKSKKKSKFAAITDPSGTDDIFIYGSVSLFLVKANVGNSYKQREIGTAFSRRIHLGIGVGLLLV